MSTQKGNTSRTRPQKHKNRTAFKNSLHDTNHRTKMINSIQVSEVCVRCKDIIEWKIKYKKYKPLTQPKTCTKCGLKNVKKAYHVMCTECGRQLGVCTKCCQSKEVIVAEPPEKEQLKLDNELKALLQSLPERKRRTFLRYLDKKGKEKEEKIEEKSSKDTTAEDDRKDLLNKLNSLKMNDEDDEDFDDFIDSDENKDEEDDSDVS
ncbi:uncharacterized protein C9orf85 homolog [Diorhabda carinulata]|uniref:uncharacterized protein C9orf85 homolog n=1 Tax=Diorhabda carinulata TaxID=1163345 RepID=UPI0024E14933|nr:uncharacterized protein C9orf85 homolog isoform X2 [Diorhabda sublineata]XP_056641538.1 uncharacterized protein C9orf85 homolog isoform X2 [Diorhabda sublineata]XP_057668343.1 uncharacterized protein C9orf85 homolog [Diorhabda carinulata]